MDKQQGMPEVASDASFDGHPTQAHADHAAIMKAHGIIHHPGRMAAVHALHKKSEGLMDMLHRRQKEVSGAHEGSPAEEAMESPAQEKAEKKSK